MCVFECCVCVCERERESLANGERATHLVEGLHNVGQIHPGCSRWLNLVKEVVSE